MAKRRFKLGMVIFTLALAWGFYTLLDSPVMGFAILCGIGFGLLIERAQICLPLHFVTCGSDAHIWPKLSLLVWQSVQLVSSAMYS